VVPDAYSIVSLLQNATDDRVIRELSKMEDLEDQLYELEDLDEVVLASAQRGSVQAMRELKKHGLYYHPQCEEDEWFPDQVLGLAVGSGNVDAVRVLLEEVPWPPDDRSSSPAIIAAAWDGNEDIVRLLVAEGFDITARNHHDVDEWGGLDALEA
jgi:hypothetical protein